MDSAVTAVEHLLFWKWSVVGPVLSTANKAGMSDPPETLSVPGQDHSPSLLRMWPGGEVQ